MSETLQVALVAGGFTLIGSILTLGTTSIIARLEAERKYDREDQSRKSEESAILHGVFALLNFLNARLNEWDEGQNFFRLNKFYTAQSYHSKLMELAPSGSDHLMILLIDLGLRIDALLFLFEEIKENGRNQHLSRLAEVQLAVGELDAAISAVDAILTAELPVSSIDELVAAGVLPSEPPDEIEESK